MYLGDKNTDICFLFLNDRSSNGSFLKEILKEEKIATGTTNGMEDRALDLVLGDDLDTDLLVGGKRIDLWLANLSWEVTSMDLKKKKKTVL